MIGPPGSPLRDDGVTIEPTCPACQGPLTPRGRRRYCSAACRQRAYRLRHGAHAPIALARRAPKATTVYECPACERRLLAEQRCPDCQVFCRRVGLGGACPHCDEAVAVADLLPLTTKGG